MAQYAGDVNSLWTREHGKLFHDPGDRDACILCTTAHTLKQILDFKLRTKVEVRVNNVKLKEGRMKKGEEK